MAKNSPAVLLDPGDDVVEYRAIDALGIVRRLEQKWCDRGDERRLRDAIGTRAAAASAAKDAPVAEGPAILCIGTGNRPFSRSVRPYIGQPRYNGRSAPE